MPSPTSPVDPLAIIAAAGLPELLKQARARYDCIIIDTAALLGTTEARLLSTMADEVLFAVRWGSTRREVVKNAFQQLRTGLGKDFRTRARAVITKVNLKKHRRYDSATSLKVCALPSRCKR